MVRRMVNPPRQRHSHTFWRGGLWLSKGTFHHFQELFCLKQQAFSILGSGLKVVFIVTALPDFLSIQKNTSGILGDDPGLDEMLIEQGYHARVFS